MAMFYSPDGAYNHWFDQAVGDSIACGNWFYHLTGLYAFSLASIYGLSLYTLSDYSDTAFLGNYQHRTVRFTYETLEELLEGIFGWVDTSCHRSCLGMCANQLKLIIC